MEEGVQPPPLPALPFPDLKKIPNYWLVDRENFPVSRRPNPDLNLQPSAPYTSISNHLTALHLHTAVMILHDWSLDFPMQ